MVTFFILTVIVLIALVLIGALPTPKETGHEKEENLKKKKGPFVKVAPVASGNKNKVAVDNTPLYRKRGWRKREKTFIF